MANPDYHKERIKIFDKVFTITSAIVVAITTWIISSIKEVGTMNNSEKSYYLLAFLVDLLFVIASFTLFQKMYSEAEKLK